MALWPLGRDAHFTHGLIVLRRAQDDAEEVVSIISSFFIITRPHRLTVRTAGSHPANRGSIPRGAATSLSPFSSSVIASCTGDNFGVCLPANASYEIPSGNISDCSRNCFSGRAFAPNTDASVFHTCTVHQLFLPMFRRTPGNRETDLRKRKPM
ncbi:MAG: hypothetical protein JWM56_679 [Candidatus Peribacteria bacterium]|nr:hypothetical protein [Candidatus Peribacteria bacterium]